MGEVVREHVDRQQKCPHCHGDMAGGVWHAEDNSDD